MGPIRDGDQVEVRRADRGLLDHRLADEGPQVLPVVAADGDDRKGLHLSGLDQRHRFKEFIKCAESAR